MLSIKKKKINQLIFKELSEFFRKKSLELSFIEYLMISITSVKINSNLTSCKVYLSIYPKKYRNMIFNQCKNNIKSYRKYLGNKLGKKLRIIPDLIFYLDISIDDLNIINNKLQNLNKDSIYKF